MVANSFAAPVSASRRRAACGDADVKQLAAAHPVPVGAGQRDGQSVPQRHEVSGGRADVDHQRRPLRREPAGERRQRQPVRRRGLQRRRPRRRHVREPAVDRPDADRLLSRRLDGVEDGEDALPPGLVTVAQLAGHGDGQRVEGRHLCNQSAQGAGQAAGVLPQGERPAVRRAVGVGRLEVGAAHVESQHGHASCVISHFRSGGRNCGGKFPTCRIPTSYKLVATFRPTALKLPQSQDAGQRQHRPDEQRQAERVRPRRRSPAEQPQNAPRSAPRRPSLGPGSDTTATARVPARTAPGRGRSFARRSARPGRPRRTTTAPTAIRSRSTLLAAAPTGRRGRLARSRITPSGRRMRSGRYEIAVRSRGSAEASRASTASGATRAR